MFSKEIFSARLFALRNSQNLTQSALANILGISQFAISKIENGQRAVSIEILYKLGDYFQVSVDYLLGRTDKPEINR